MAHHVGRIVAAALTIAASAGAASAGPARVPNTQPYRVTATATATGRTGSAMMSARALIDRDRQARLEVVTGDFETAPMGSLTKLQVKAYDGNGNLVLANNYGPLSTSSMILPLASLSRGQALDIQGNIRNVDNNRTDVVSVTAVGKLRPDLAAVTIDAPPNAPAGMPVHVTATIAELNHDTGARATCLLSVDDIPVDRAAGIWVDAGDTVSCAFSRVFASGGFHRIRVSATDVNPGDWDTANNAVETGISIVTATDTFDFGSASVSSSYRRYRSHDTGYLRQGSDNFVTAWENLNDQFEDSDGAQYHAYINRTAVSFPLTQIVVSQWSDDTLIHAGVFNAVATTSAGPTLSCAMVVDDSADQAAHVEVCAHGGGPGGSGITSITYGRFAGTVTYFASQYQAAWYETPEGVVPVYEYSFNHRQGHTAGTARGVGDTYRFEVTLIAGNTAYSRPATIRVGPLQVFSDVNYPWSCVEDATPYGYRKTCQEFINYSSARFGMVVW
jgi:hypothetical protein